MKHLLYLVVEAVVGLALAGLILAVLLPALVEAGYLRVGSQSASWIVGGVIAACVALAVLRPWKYLSTSSGQKDR